ncbi:hypothetical protein [Mycobacterium sp. NPDC006124]|uniref:hypothetical protein n=1 Tax=Mycobacterium sp. NPDC006124 TaxID=3156729 RepID=UPI0033A2BCB3
MFVYVSFVINADAEVFEEQLRSLKDPDTRAYVERRVGTGNLLDTIPTEKASASCPHGWR